VGGFPQKINNKLGLLGMMDDLDELGYEEIKHRFVRGDYHDPTKIKSVKNG